MNSKTSLDQVGTARTTQASGQTCDAEVRVAMAQLYDHYFACHAYEERYPQPNQATLDFLMKHGAGKAEQVLDFGCGNGRYALALLQHTSASLTGCDISEAALMEFRRHLDQKCHDGRIHLLLGDSSALSGSGNYDLILMLFGVLGHVGARHARIETLRHLRVQIRAEGKLLLTVPSQWRRRPVEFVRSTIDRFIGQARGVRTEQGNILFTRVLAGVSHQFFYHLYTVRRLREELQEAGFRMTVVEAESVLPEWMITQHPWVGEIDARLARLIPAALGYGMRAVAVPE